MYNASYLMMAPREDFPEMRRTQQEREHPDAFTTYEIKSQLDKGKSLRIRVQSIICVLRTPYRSAPAGRIQSSPVTQ